MNCNGTAAVVFSTNQRKRGDEVGEGWIAVANRKKTKKKNNCYQVKPT